jgi:rhodanese-related sulfurtransferase
MGSWLALGPSVALAGGEPISPEAVRKLQISKAPLLLLDAQATDSAARDPGSSQLLIVYYSRSPSARPAVRAAQEAARSARDSRWLAGTPLDWQREQLAIAEPIPSEPLRLEPKELATAIKDGADLQLLDIRGREQFDQGHLPGAQHQMPHELDAALAKLSKARWTILIDDGTRLAEPMARELYRKGYVLAGWLAGGYPAWAAEPDK